MDRVSIIKEVGKLKPSIFEETNSVNFSSTFIVPIPHNVHKSLNATSFFKNIDKNWEIKNDTIEKDLSLYDIKKYIKESMFQKIPKGEKQKRNFILDGNNLYLRYKHTIPLIKYGNIQLVLSRIDLWIMEGNIAFFTYMVELNTENLLDINTISSKINRDLRDFRELSINIEKQELYFRDKDNGISIVEYFLSLTKNDKKSFLNIEFNDSSFNVEDDLQTIHESSYYAKMITALHIDDDHIKIADKDYPITSISDTLKENVNIDIGILSELSFLLGTTASFDFKSELEYVNHENYTYTHIQEQGINIWKFWSGIALLDSVAFISVKKGGSGITYAAKTSNYFIYMLNLYVNIRLEFFENYIIDKDFISIERIYPAVKEIQRIKNHYIANQVSRKFQPNHIHKKIAEGLNNNDVLSEIEENIATTLELTKNNTDIVFSIASGLAAISSIWLSGDMIVKWYNTHPYITTATIFIFVMASVVVVSKKSYIIRLIKQSFKSLKRFFT